MRTKYNNKQNQFSY